MGSDLMLAAVADDYTGGSDMAGMLAGEGVRTVQMFGVPDAGQIDYSEVVSLDHDEAFRPWKLGIQAGETAKVGQGEVAEIH